MPAANEARRAIAIATLKEHDLVRALREINSDGFLVAIGAVGTVVSVYRPGEAFAVEFPEVKDGPAVVTVRGDEIESMGLPQHESN